VKRLFAILMLVVLLFNSIGYRIVSYILEGRADHLLQAKIDAEQIDESQLIKITIPLKLPYHTEWKDFESYSGEVKVNGTYYKYVKRKVIVDSLVLLCIPNNGKLAFESSRDRFFQLINDLKNPLEKKSGSIYNNLISDYLQKDNSFSLSVPINDLDLSYPISSSFISKICLERPVKPPEQRISI
jgi:hypothetical protein